jgi:hypothetical protein
MRYLPRRKICPICNCPSNIPGRENDEKNVFFLENIFIKLNVCFDLDQATATNVHNMIRRVIEQRNKKNPMEYGWLSKTDMTIVAVSILFVILLAIINLILFAVRR